MINWIGRHRTWTTFLIIGILWIGYIGYTNVWEPVSMVEDAKVAAGETVDITKDLIDYVSQKVVIDLLKVLIPLIPVIVTWRRKAGMDTTVRQTTNKVVRDKLGIADRRKHETKDQIEKRKQYKKKNKK